MFLVCLTFHYCGVLSESMWGIHYAPTFIFYQTAHFLVHRRAGACVGTAQSRLVVGSVRGLCRSSMKTNDIVQLVGWTAGRPAFRSFPLSSPRDLDKSLIFFPPLPGLDCSHL